MGSAFKLYVLGAVAEGRPSWDRELAIREDRKSLPSGAPQDEPPGTRSPLRDDATTRT
ncbi:hypothetical protein [Actinophytocola sp.]|uniref:hypothetical protein n=1 Tax=Actinophytocola sp. TaxID=1872138 RepID=UPI003D6C0E6D